LRFHRLELALHGCGELFPAFREEIFDRAEHEGERRAELVATLLKNAVFARSISASASARCFSSSKAEATATALAIWVRRSSKKSW